MRSSARVDTRRAAPRSRGGGAARATHHARRLHVRRRGGGCSAGARRTAWSCVLITRTPPSRFLTRPPLRQGLEWFASLLREDEDGDVADEFLIEAACVAQEEPAAAECRGALRTLAVSRRPRRPPAWQRVVGGWPLCADVAA